MWFDVYVLDLQIKLLCNFWAFWPLFPENWAKFLVTLGLVSSLWRMFPSDPSFVNMFAILLTKAQLVTFSNFFACH